MLAKWKSLLARQVIDAPEVDREAERHSKALRAAMRSITGGKQ
jgi:hypothetical protein